MHSIMLLLLLELNSQVQLLECSSTMVSIIIIIVL